MTCPSSGNASRRTRRYVVHSTPFRSHPHRRTAAPSACTLIPAPCTMSHRLCIVYMLCGTSMHLQVILTVGRRASSRFTPQAPCSAGSLSLGTATVSPSIDSAWQRVPKPYRDQSWPLPLPLAPSQSRGVWLPLAPSQSRGVWRVTKWRRVRHGSGSSGSINGHRSAPSIWHRDRAGRIGLRLSRCRHLSIGVSTPDGFCLVRSARGKSSRAGRIASSQRVVLTRLTGPWLAR